MSKDKKKSKVSKLKEDGPPKKKKKKKKEEEQDWSQGEPFTSPQGLLGTRLPFDKKKD